MHVDDAPTPGLDAAGRPDPAYAARLGLRPAPTGRRSAAFALDATAWVVLAVPGLVGAALLAGALLGGPGPADPTAAIVLLSVSQGVLLVFATVQLVLHGRRGLTLGKAALGLRSVGVAQFGAPGFWHVVLRVLVLCAGQLVLPVVGPALLFASSAWDPERRGRSWLDRVGSCWAIDVRRGLDPLDARALRHARRGLDAPAAADAPSLPSLASDRNPGEELFIPSARSSSGVVSAAPAEAGAWMPPPLGPTAAPEPPGAASAAPDPSGAASAEPNPAGAASVEPEPAGAASVASIVLVFDDGTRVPVAAGGLLGRSPALTPEDSGARLVPLVDESMRISKTHAAYGIDGGGLWLVDRASRNGTFVELPDGSSRRLPPWERTTVPTGARVALGSRSFTVTEASGR